MKGLTYINLLSMLIITLAGCNPNDSEKMALVPTVDLSQQFKIAPNLTLRE